LKNDEAKDLKEVVVGFAQMGVGDWRGSISGILEKMQVAG